MNKVSFTAPIVPNVCVSPCTPMHPGLNSNVKMQKQLHKMCVTDWFEHLSLSAMPALLESAMLGSVHGSEPSQGRGGRVEGFEGVRAEVKTNTNVTRGSWALLLVGLASLCPAACGWSGPGKVNPQPAYARSPASLPAPPPPESGWHTTDRPGTSGWPHRWCTKPPQWKHRQRQCMKHSEWNYPGILTILCTLLLCPWRQAVK